MTLNDQDREALDEFIKKEGATPESAFAETATEAWAACCEHRDRMHCDVVAKAVALDVLTQNLSDERKRQLKSLIEDAKQHALDQPN